MMKMRDAIKQFNHFASERKKIKKVFESKFGPLYNLEIVILDILGTGTTLHGLGKCRINVSR